MPNANTTVRIERFTLDAPDKPLMEVQRVSRYVIPPQGYGDKTEFASREEATEALIRRERINAVSSFLRGPNGPVNRTLFDHVKKADAAPLSDGQLRAIATYLVDCGDRLTKRITAEFKINYVDAIERKE